tara:strand:+ start:63 stop:1364 length:1302 start_codon:yes stop_codon:yes gene_type:complete
MNNKLPAILGGKPVNNYQFKNSNYIGKEEKKAVNRVLDSGILSGFVGAWVPEFYGGSEVKKLEKNWSKFFKVKHSISMNSATSGLIAAIGALDIQPGDEVIIPPTTMTASAAAILFYNAIPVFVDICPNTFCIDVDKIEKAITKKTKAILVVNIYGHTANWSKINKIAKKYNLKTIEDAAQTAGGFYGKKHSGTLGDIGVFSLNRHKTIQCGEGGVCVTNDDNLCERLQLIRNHAEAVVKNKKTKNLSNLIGYNFRMTEIEAAIANEQLKKLKKILNTRINICRKIIDEFMKFDGFTPPQKKYCSANKIPMKHTFYYLTFLYDRNKFKLSRDVFVKAMNKEGIPLELGGYEPLYNQPVYKNKIAFGKNHFPFSLNKKIMYKKGSCPVAERLWYKDLFYFPIDEVVPPLNKIKLFSKAIKKILENQDSISKNIK